MTKQNKILKPYFEENAQDSLCLMLVVHSWDNINPSKNLSNNYPLQIVTHVASKFMSWFFKSYIYLLHILPYLQISSLCQHIPPAQRHTLDLKFVQEFSCSKSLSLSSFKATTCIMACQSTEWSNYVSTNSGD